MAFVKTRVNQSVFRERLLKKYHTCCLCKVENQALLTASHIKPWAASSADEKLDAENGFCFALIIMHYLMVGLFRLMMMERL